MMIRSVLAAFVSCFVLVGVASAQNCGSFIPNNLVNGANADATQVNTNFAYAVSCAMPRGYLSGLTLSTGGSSVSFGIAVGGAKSDDNITQMYLSTPYTKSTTAWAVGSGNGSLDTGSIALNTWYHIFLIERIDTGVVDILASLSATAPTLPTSYTKLRRIGSMKTDGTAQWVKFVQDGDLFEWDVPVLDLNLGNPGTAPVLRTLSVPPGINVVAYIRARTVVSTGGTFTATLYSDPAVADTTPDFSGNGQQLSNTTLAPMATLQIRSNTSAQIRMRCSFSDPGTNATIATEGWRDTRGK